MFDVGVIISFALYLVAKIEREKVESLMDFVGVLMILDIISRFFFSLQQQRG